MPDNDKSRNSECHAPSPAAATDSAVLKSAQTDLKTAQADLQAKTGELSKANKHIEELEKQLKQANDELSQLKGQNPPVAGTFKNFKDFIKQEGISVDSVTGIYSKNGVPVSGTVEIGNQKINFVDGIRSVA